MMFFAEGWSRAFQVYGYATDEIWYAACARNILAKCFGYNITVSYETTNESFAYPSNVKLDNLNLIHPPLAKYFIALSIAVFGYWPWSWRYPSLVLSSALPLLAYLTGRKVGGAAGGAIASTLVFLDALIRKMMFLAFLDVYMCFFGALFLALWIYRREKAALFSLGLAFSCKWNALFLALALLPRWLAEERKLKDAVLRLASFVLMPYLALSLPLIIAVGLPLWLYYQASAVGFHATLPAGSHPYASSPLDWLVNRRDFALYVLNGETVYASFNGLLLLFTVLAALAIAPKLLKWRENHDALALLAFPLGFWLCHMALYAIGRTAQFSFYAYTLSYGLDVCLGAFVGYAVERYKGLLAEWKSLLLGVRLAEAGAS